MQQPIVIVEDDDGMRQALERLLRTAGYSTMAFGSAEALFLTTAATQAACLILDVRLPGLSGLELRDRLDQAGTSRPVVFITAHDEPRAREAARRAGALAYLLKPFAGRELLGAVARACCP